ERPALLGEGLGDLLEALVALPPTPEGHLDLLAPAEFGGQSLLDPEIALPHLRDSQSQGAQLVRFLGAVRLQAHAELAQSLDALVVAEIDHALEGLGRRAFTLQGGQ